MTNPDNVGGLPERWRGLADKCEAEFPQKAQIFRWCANELCRAAPAGGDDVYGWVLTGPEGSMFCPATHRHVMEAILKVDGCSAVAVYTRPLVSATAGSGEVEALAMWLVLRAEGGSEGDYVATKLRKAAALLRKLQQGADYRFRLLEVGEVILEHDEYVNDYGQWAKVKPPFLGMAYMLSMRTVRRAASQDQEGGK